MIGSSQLMDGAGGNAPNALTLFLTPHSIGGGGFGSGPKVKFK